MTTYKVFIGGWDVEGVADWVKFEADGLTWDEATATLRRHLASFEGDDCEHCRERAAEELARLESADPGEFAADVEGDDYIIFVNGQLTGGK